VDPEGIRARQSSDDLRSYVASRVSDCISGRYHASRRYVLTIDLAFTGLHYIGSLLEPLLYQQNHS
jgi:hypothetical protein